MAAARSSRGSVILLPVISAAATRLAAEEVESLTAADGGKLKCGKIALSRSSYCMDWKLIWLRKFGSRPSRTDVTPLLVPDDWLAISLARGGLVAKGPPCPSEKEPREARVALETGRLPPEGVADRPRKSSILSCLLGMAPGGAGDTKERLWRATLAARNQVCHFAEPFFSFT